MPRQFDGVETGVVDGFGLQSQFERRTRLAIASRRFVIVEGVFSLQIEILKNQYISRLNGIPSDIPTNVLFSGAFVAD